MKNFLLLLIIITLITSCTKESEISNTRSTQQTCAYLQYGQMHNDGLDYVYQTLSNYSNLSENKEKEFMQQAITDYVVNTLGFTNPTPLFNSIESNFDVIYQGTLNERLALLASLGYSQGFITEIERIALVNPSDYTNVFDYHNALDIVYNSSPLKGQSIYDVPFDILKGSSCYWSANYSEWINGVSTRDTEYDWFGYALHDMFEADFWSGLTVGLFTGPVGGVSAACYGSASSGIQSLWNRWNS